MIDIRQLQLENTKRSIIISDIHADLTLFKRLLVELKYSEQDYLFINGDLCEKGENSLEVISYVQTLIAKSQNVFVTKGNCDVVHRYVYNGEEGIRSYMNKQKNSLLNEMLSLNGMSVDDFPTLQELTHYYRQHYKHEIEWLESLPIAYETDDFIVIHAGIENGEEWRQTDEKSALYTQAFHEKGHQADKTVIVGHWPAVNYRSEQISSNNPLIDLDKKIISIDGGNQIKKDGQLNALIFENGIYSYVFVDDLTQKLLVQEEVFNSSEIVGTVTYPNYEMTIIKREPYFTLCENKALGIQQWIKNEYLIVEEDQIRCKGDVSTTFLNVRKGETVWVVDDTCVDYLLVKKANGEVGWLPAECVANQY